MKQIKYKIAQEACGNRELTHDKTLIAVDHIEDGEIVDSEEFSIASLQAHIERLKSEGRDVSVLSQALKEAKE